VGGPLNRDAGVTPMNNQTPHTPSAQERRRKERAILVRALGVSLGLHLLVFFLWQGDSPLMSPFAAAGPREGDDRAAAGGGMQSIALQEVQSLPITPPPIPLATLDEVVVQEFEPEVRVEVGDLPGVLAEDPAGEGAGPPGPGREDGTGRGDGGTADEGLFRVVPPSPRGMIIPPTNRNLRGRQVEVWVFVNEAGRVEPDSTQLRPPTSDRSFNQRIIQEASQWVFEPAKRGGQPVAAWFPYTISM